MKAILVVVCLSFLAIPSFAGPFNVVFNPEVKNVTCARASLGLVQSYLRKQNNTLEGEVNVRELQKSASYLIIGKTPNQAVVFHVSVFDMHDEDGTCTATHLQFANGQWLDLQNMAFSQRYPAN